LCALLGLEDRSSASLSSRAGTLLLFCVRFSV
jgi:hypothetical protein